MSWESELKRKFGLSVEDYWRIYEYQGGKCAICQKPPHGRDHMPVDHDHATGEVRGLLCQACNYDFLGVWGDKPARYRRTAGYLVVHPAAAAIGVRYVPDAPPRREP